MNLFKLVGSVFVDTQGAENSLRKLDVAGETSANKIGQMGTKFQKVGQSISNVGAKMTALVTVPLVGIGVASVKTAADFDATMSEVQAISGATGDEMKALADKAREMGATTSKSAKESAEALTYMGMAGWDASEMIAGLPGVIRLSEAAGSDLARTSDIVTDGLTAFGLSAKDTQSFVDVLAATSSAANTNVEMMGETFKYVGPVCGSLGISMQDAALASGIMANSGKLIA